MPEHQPREPRPDEPTPGEPRPDEPTPGEPSPGERTHDEATRDAPTRDAPARNAPTTNEPVHHEPTPPAPPAPPTSPTAEQFRRAAARYATGIAVVTTRADGVDHAMTANSFTTVSLDPQLALVCVERDSRFHRAVCAAGVWSVTFLAADAQDSARWFATRGRDLAGQFDQVATRRGRNGCLLLTDGLASLELRTERVAPAGDHDIVLGAVTSVHEPADAHGPLVYFSSTFHTLA